MSKDALYQIAEYLDCQLMRRFFKIHQIVSLFAPYWAQIGVSPLIFVTSIPIPQTCFLPNLVQISSVVLESEHFKCILLYKPT